MNYVLWFTGLSGSGKSTLAHGLAKILKKKKLVVQIIDGDEFRKKVHSKLGFSKKEIILNNKRIIQYCLRSLKNKNFILVPVIAPFESTRRLARRKISASYIEIFCKVSLEKCIERDTKGLYKKALNGEIKNFIGIDKNVPYQIPEYPDVIINTDKLNVDESLEKILRYLRIKSIYD